MNTFNFRRVNGSALAITVFIGLFLSSISLIIILQAYNSKTELIKLYDKERLERNAQAGINYILTDTSQSGCSRTCLRNLYNQSSDSILTTRISWGVYQIGLSESWDAHDSVRKTFLYGAELPGDLKGCIYLIDHDRPLSLVGGARLEGDAAIPRAGVRIAYIDQRGYDLPELIYGISTISSNQAPAISASELDYLRSLLTLGPSYKVKDLDTNSETDVIHVSFWDSLQHYSFHGKFETGGRVWRDHVVLQSDSLIEIGSSSLLSNVIVCAPVIRIMKGFNGNLQCIATDSIIVEGNAHLTYPSALVLIKSKKTADRFQPQIIIRKNCAIEGVVFSYADSSDLYKTNVLVEDQCSITGLLFVSGYLNLRSNVTGCVCTDYFVYAASSSIYENHLVDVQINRKILSKYYVGPSVFLSNNINRVIQWLDPK